MVGIVSNSAALFAQRNLNIASASSEASIARLSSGNRIISASDDVAGLAIGTVLKTNVSTLRTVLTSTSQALSMLSIADGGLSNIGDILQRQKSLAVSANTGALSNNERAFLNQEFQALSSEIDRLVDATVFNGIKLLDGSLGGVGNVGSATGTGTTETYSLNNTSDYSINNAPTTGVITGVATAGDITTALSQTIATIDFAGGDADDTVDINIGGVTTGATTTFVDDAATARAMVVALYNAQAGAAAGEEIHDYMFEAVGAQVVIRAKEDSGDNSGDNITITAAGNAITHSFNGAAYTGTAGDTGPVTIETGTPPSSYTAEVAGTAGNTVFDLTMQGAITDISASFIAGEDQLDNGFVNNSVQFTAVVNGQTYVSDALELTGGADFDGTNYTLGTVLESGAELTFRQAGTGATQQTFRLTTGQDLTIANQTNADTAATSIQGSLDTASTALYQSREVATISTDNIIGTVLDGITASDVLLRSDAFASDGTFGSISEFTVDRANAEIDVTINGVVYTTDLNSYAGTHVDNTSFNLDNTMVFTTADTTDSRQLSIDLSAATLAGTLNYDTDADALAVANLFNELMNVGGQNGALTFQVGASAADTIDVSISGATTASVYKNANGDAVTLSIGTAGSADGTNGGDGSGAVLASNVLDRAITTVTSLRADLGALQSRFNFAATNITTNIQNTEAARSDFLDVDIADESTQFATAQVRLQASISVLAQANQLPQNLLKLIG